MNGTSGLPLPPISMMPKWRVFAPSRLHNSFGGVGGKRVNCACLFCARLQQNEWNIWTTPPPYFNDAKLARFCSFAPSSLLSGGRGLIVPFYSVQDCSSPRSRYVGFVFQCNLCFFSVICVTRRVCFFKKIQDFPKETHPYRDFLRTIFGLKIGYCLPHPPVPN